MRAIYRIARLELSNLFYSPIAWLILILFVFMTAMNFTDMLWAYARSQEFRGGGLSDLSRALFFDATGRGLWPKISNLLYMIMPLLTMGLISQEFSRGSIKLLFVAPITSRHIVLGKFLGMMMYGLLMFSVLLVYVILGGCWIESFDWAAVLTGLLGLYLLFGTYAAIGLFMSTLTTYPIVAAIYMLALLTFLRFVSGLWQEYTFVRDITYWLALDRRAGTFINGMICSEDFLYFVIMTAMFLGFAILKLQFIRERRSALSKVGRFLGVFIVAMLLIRDFSVMLRLYHDSTHTKTNTLTEASQEIVSKLDGD
ncbi:MAG: ABC transporter permease [Butyricimonas faecalis]